MDEYKKYYYATQDKLAVIDTKSVQKRRDLRKQLNCKSFQWYMENILPEVVVPKWEPEYFGLLNMKNDESVCLRVQGGKRIIMDSCDNMDGEHNVFGVDKAGQLKWNNISCMQSNTTNNRVYLGNCDVGTMWKVTKENTILHMPSNNCLTKDGTGIVLAHCENENTSQQWHFSQHFNFNNANWNAERAFEEAIKPPADAVKFGALENPLKNKCVHIMEGKLKILPCVQQARFHKTFYINKKGIMKFQNYCFTGLARDGAVEITTDCDAVTSWTHVKRRLMAYDMCLTISDDSALELAACEETNIEQVWVFRAVST